MKISVAGRATTIYLALPHVATRPHALKFLQMMQYSLRQDLTEFHVFAMTIGLGLLKLMIIDRCVARSTTS